MTGPRQEIAPKRFYTNINLAERIPEDHLLRRINATLDLESLTKCRVSRVAAKTAQMPGRLTKPYPGRCGQEARRRRWAVFAATRGDAASFAAGRRRSGWTTRLRVVLALAPKFAPKSKATSREVR
jgi:hypothetical protein